MVEAGVAFGAIGSLILAVLVYMVKIGSLISRIDQRLAGVESRLERLESSFSNFRLGVSERVTRIEASSGVN